MKNSPFYQFKRFGIIILAVIFLVLSCDDRVPTEIEDESSLENFVMTITTQPYALEGSTTVVVGEDIAGPINDVNTRIDVILTDTTGNPLKAKNIEFSSNVGSFSINSSTPTNDDGKATVNFYDEDSAAYDGYGEGAVSVTAKHVENETEISSTTSFEVFDTSIVQIWPYNLILNTDTDVINLDGGQTNATITVRLLNNLSHPVKFVDIGFDATKGFIDAVGITDSTGVVDVNFTDLGNPEDVGVADINASFIHPSFGEVTQEIQITIVDTTYSGTPAYLTIPPSYPGEIMVVGGGGLESTQICSRVYDENAILVNEPVNVTFTLGPNIPVGANINNAGISDSSYTESGEACVSVNSGTGPGPVRITAEVTTESGEVLSATEVPVIIATGPPYYIEPNYDPGATTPIGGGAYQTEAAAMVYDVNYNPVSDSTYVYWSMDPVPPDTMIDAFVQGVSFTGNQNLNEDNYPGVAFTTIIYSTDAIGDLGYVTALTFGANGDTVMARINEDEGEAIMFFVPGQLLLAGPQYWDFTLFGNPAILTIIGILTDYYGNAVVNAPILLSATGASAIYWPFSPIENNIGYTDSTGTVTFTVEYDQGICSPVPNSDPQTYEDFTSTVVAQLLIPQAITSAPLEILLVRTYQR